LKISLCFGGTYCLHLQDPIVSQLIIGSLFYALFYPDFFYSIYLKLPAALDLGFSSVFNRNEYQKQRNNACGKYSAAFS
jgi:hypothetical protein